MRRGYTESGARPCADDDVAGSADRRPFKRASVSRMDLQRVEFAVHVPVVVPVLDAGCFCYSYLHRLFN